jgi:hypothetical protein
VSRERPQPIRPFQPTPHSFPEDFAAYLCGLFVLKANDSLPLMSRQRPLIVGDVIGTAVAGALVAQSHPVALLRKRDLRNKFMTRLLLDPVVKGLFKYPEVRGEGFFAHIEGV